MFLVVINSCTKDKGELEKPDVPGCDTTASITYTNYVSALLATNCTLSGCHDKGAPFGYDYTSYTAIKSKVDDGTFKDRVLTTKDMPPSPATLDACTLLKLQVWVKRGAQQ